MTMNDRYDAIVIGAGAGGGVAACVLAEAGQRVLLLDRGKAMRYEEVSRGHLRNHRHAKYGHNTGPELTGNPRVFVDQRGKATTVKPFDGRWMNNAMVVGGGTRVFGAQAWRYLPDDFRMASRYGVPAGSSLADWPISYDDLAPYYERAEWELGVAGDSEISARIWPRNKPYPMPGVPDNADRHILRAGAKKLGWETLAVPLLINTTQYNGRLPCAQCGNCVGFACPSDSKSGSHNTVISRALKTGLCELLTEAQAERIDIDDRGAVIGVTFFARRNGAAPGDGAGAIQRRSVRGKRVIVSAGAIETARLLLHSSSKFHPHGLGNSNDMVGRNLQGHLYVGAHAIFPEPRYDPHGPGVSISTVKFSHGNPGVIGGGMLANEFITMPIMFWAGSLPPGMRRWGIEAKRFMRENYVRTAHVQGPIQDIPNPEARVTLDPFERDRYGIPAARLSGAAHPASVQAGEFLRERAIEWMNASGATRVWSAPAGTGLTGGQHQAGTCRMGADEKSGVTNAWGRVHGHDNLYCADGSLHVTNGGFNPVLTILALGYRVADGILRRR